jgi:hypothetical protein
MMAMTELELARLTQEELRPFCVKVDERYICRTKINNVWRSYRGFSTIAKCNAEYDKVSGVKAYNRPNKAKVPASKGYREMPNNKPSKRFEARLFVKKVYISIGSFSTKEEARAAYLEGWYKAHNTKPEEIEALTC